MSSCSSGCCAAPATPPSRPRRTRARSASSTCKNRYDLILLDLQMPGMDGFQVMEGLKEIEPDGYLPVLVITAQPGHKLRALQAGAKDFVSKPFDLAEVLARVHNMLEVRLLHLETKRLYERVVAEQKVSERLLLNVLPASIAERLKGRPEVAAEQLAGAHRRQLRGSDGACSPTSWSSRSSPRA